MAEENKKKNNGNDYWYTTENNKKVHVQKGESPKQALERQIGEKIDDGDHKVNGGKPQDDDFDNDYEFENWDKEDHKEQLEQNDFDEDELWEKFEKGEITEQERNDLNAQRQQKLMEKPIDDSAMERLKIAVSKGKFNRYDEWDTDNANFKTAINYINQNPELRKDIESYIKDYYQARIDEWEEEGDKHMADFVRNDLKDSLAQLDSPNESTISDSDPEASFYNIVSDRLEEHFKKPAKEKQVSDTRRLSHVTNGNFTNEDQIKAFIRVNNKNGLSEDDTVDSLLNANYKGKYFLNNDEGKIREYVNNVLGNNQQKEKNKQTNDKVANHVKGMSAKERKVIFGTENPTQEQIDALIKLAELLK